MGLTTRSCRGPDRWAHLPALGSGAGSTSSLSSQGLVSAGILIEGNAPEVEFNGVSVEVGGEAQEQDQHPWRRVFKAAASPGMDYFRPQLLNTFIND